MGLVIVILLAGIAVWFLMRTRQPGDGYESQSPRPFRRPERYDDPPPAPSAQKPVITDRRSAELDAQLDEWEAEQRRKDGQPRAGDSDS